MTALEIYQCQLQRLKDPNKAWASLSAKCRQKLESQYNDLVGLPAFYITWTMKAYCAQVKRLTKLEPLHELVGHDMPKADSWALLRSERHYILDHKISIAYGYANKVPPEDIAHICNLRYITAADNARKGTKNAVDDANRHLMRPA